MSCCILVYYIWHLFSFWKTVDLHFHCMSLNCIFFQTSRPVDSYTEDMHFPLTHFCLWISPIISMCFPGFKFVTVRSGIRENKKKVQSNEKLWSWRWDYLPEDLVTQGEELWQVECEFDCIVDWGPADWTLCGVLPRA